MFPSTHDIVEISPFKEACFTALENLLYSKNEVLITSKPRIEVIREIDDKFNEFKDQIQFRFTITSTCNDLLRFWEPNYTPLRRKVLLSRIRLFKGLQN